MLMVTVFLWTTSNFMASYIFSDNTYSKPFFLVYLNTSVFAVSLVPALLRFVGTHGLHGTRRAARGLLQGFRQDVRDKATAFRRRGRRRPAGSGRGSDSSNGDHEAAAAAEGLLAGDANQEGAGPTTILVADADTDTDTDAAAAAPPKLTLRETAWFSLEFCVLWFAANYLAVACLAYTSVASATIFTSLSGVFTLLFCAAAGVERFSVRKLAGVVASLAGVVLVSLVDLRGGGNKNDGGQDEDDNGGSRFPHKTARELALGDAMALLSAAVYGGYVTVMKRRVGREDRMDLPLFFGLVGLCNMVCLWPGFVVLHLTGLETFALPPTGRIWMIVLLNAFASLVSDMAWAYAMLLTTPLVVTVGLSLTIPLSLVGEMVQYGQYASGLYWAGAGVVVLSFLFVNHESHEAGETAKTAEGGLGEDEAAAGAVAI
ncbi:rab small monomeric GTPase [Niveomyces insectorum RCEF 264]|uniref:Rab small monomeric GTPase n=1 Tax=Niveomyces insectorum RCEF 264 TaxID=1081102 RepID=A0A167TCS0_9HYPO|nr:rab small monomeric GTPase [Niveomyces insectorum RCEF 264]